MKNIESCCFTGHRPDKLPWKYNEHDPRCLTLKSQLRDALQSLYTAGCRRFLCGMAEGCDLYFGEAVVALREEHSEIFLEGAIPFEGQSEKWSESSRRRYFRLAEECDKLTVLHSSYSPDCMMDRNRYMVDHADLLLAVYNGSSGGTQATMLYALRKGLEIVEISVEK